MSVHFLENLTLPFPLSTKTEFAWYTCLNTSPSSRPATYNYFFSFVDSVSLMVYLNALLLTGFYRIHLIRKKILHVVYSFICILWFPVYRFAQLTTSFFAILLRSPTVWLHKFSPFTLNMRVRLCRDKTGTAVLQGPDFGFPLSSYSLIRWRLIIYWTTGLLA